MRRKKGKRGRKERGNQFDGTKIISPGNEKCERAKERKRKREREKGRKKGIWKPVVCSKSCGFASEKDGYFFVSTCSLFRHQHPRIEIQERERDVFYYLMSKTKSGYFERSWRIRGIAEVVQENAFLTRYLLTQLWKKKEGGKGGKR